ncbi:MAG: hypothetical protein ACE5Q6_02285 [Dehalococcoidia bacterium]
MAKRYETIEEVQAVLRSRNILATQREIESSLDYLDLPLPLGPGDLPELVENLGPGHKVNPRILRTERILSSKEWAEAVADVRRKMGLPPGGLTQDQARRAHDALIDTFGGDPMDITLGKRKQPIVPFFKDLVEETRRLGTLLSINPLPLDDLRASYAGGFPNMLLGVRKLLYPESGINLFGREATVVIDQSDHLIGHVLWNHPLDIRTMEPRPWFSFVWERLEGNSGRFVLYKFNEEEATAAERRALQAKVKETRKMFRDGLLLSVLEEEPWLGMTWEQRWQRWNRLFPDFAVPTAGALRKACDYALPHKEETQAYFKRVTTPPDSRLQTPLADGQSA